MTEYARVENGVIAERRHIDFMPPHKAYLWRPVVHEGTGTNEQTTIEPDRVLIVYSTPEPPPLTADDYAAAIEAHVDNVAKAKAYGGGVSLASYLYSTVPQWQEEAQTFVAWRDAVWAYAYLQMAMVQAGQRSQPTVADLILELPGIVWPNAPST